MESPLVVNLGATSDLDRIQLVAPFLCKKPSLRQAVDQFCLRCRDQDVFAIANCETFECPLHPVRSNQALCGKVMEDFDTDTLVQSVEDALDFPSLQERGLEYL